MNQDDLRAMLQALIAERAQAGESLADVGRVIAQVINSSAGFNGRGVDPDHAHLTRQYVHMLAAGKTRITDEIADAIQTLAALQDGVSDLQAHARQVTTPLWTLHPIPPNALITDPAHPCRLPGCRVQIIGRRAYCGPEHKREAARKRRRTSPAPMKPEDNIRTH